MQKLNLPEYPLRIQKKNDQLSVFDIIRKKFVIAAPEEWVRQNFIHYLIFELHYPQGLMAVESGIEVNTMKYRPDIVVFNIKGDPYMIVECKAPEIAITQKVFDQVARYNINFKVDYLVVTNGMQHFCCKINHAEGSYNYLDHIPAYS